MLRMAYNMNWQEIVSNKELYGELPFESSKIKARRMKLAGHFLHPEEKASNLVLWQPGWGRRNRGRQKITYYIL